MKVVINVCYGGFGLSNKAMHRYAELKGIKKLYDVVCNFDKSPFKFEYPPDAEKELIIYHITEPLNDDGTYNDGSFWDPEIERDDPDLIRVIEEFGVEANGSCAELRIVEIPDGTKFTIEEYDGKEHVAEVHRTWYGPEISETSKELS